MRKNNQDILARAYALLQGLRNNVATLSWVEETYVKKYHSVLDMLEEIGIDTTAFRVPDSEVKRHVTMSSPERTVYSDESYVPKALLLAKLDAILIYFEIITSEEPKKIGFSPPDK